jgi:hypothetical protein
MASKASAIFNGFYLYILLTAASDCVGIWFDTLQWVLVDVVLDTFYSHASNKILELT